MSVVGSIDFYGLLVLAFVAGWLVCLAGVGLLALVARRKLKGARRGYVDVGGVPMRSDSSRSSSSRS